MIGKHSLTMLLVVTAACASAASAATLPACLGGTAPSFARPYTVIKYVSAPLLQPTHQIDGVNLGKNFAGLWVIQGDLTNYTGLVEGYQASYVYFISGHFCLSGRLGQDLTFPLTSFVTFVNGVAVLSQSGWTLTTEWGYAGVDAYGFNQGGSVVDNVFQQHFDNAGNPSWKINNYTRSHGKYTVVVYK